MQQSYFVGTSFWFLLQEPSPPLHSFVGLKESETVFSPVWLGMAGAQAGAADSYFMNGLEADLTLTMWQNDGFCEFQCAPWPYCLQLSHAGVPPT